MSKLIEFDQSVRNKLLEGVKKISKAVTSTLGPYGRNVIIEKNGELPSSTKDGVTVAKSISLEDPIENIGAEIVKQAAIKSAELAGDGTTTTTILSHLLFQNCLRYLEKNINPVELKKGIEEGVSEVIEYIYKHIRKPISSEEQYNQIAYISSNNDKLVGELISKALKTVGSDGIVSIEESKTGETYLETVLGTQFNKGYKSPHFVTNTANMNVVLNNPYILIYDGIINTVKELLPVLEYTSINNKPLLIIAQDIEGEALATLIVNKVKGNIQTCAVKAPDFGDRRTLILEDLSILTGGTLISKEKGFKLEKLNSTSIEPLLGSAKTVTITKDDTTIIEGKGNIELIQNRVLDIKTQLENSKTPFEKEKLQERIASLVAGVALLYVGGHTEIELKELKDRVEDALYATKAAIKDGIIPGGGLALLRAQHNLKVSNELNDKNLGKKILFSILDGPFNTICSNAGIENIFEIKSLILNNPDLWYGYDLSVKEYGNLETKGIIDPYLVLYSALINASSVVGTLLTTEAVVYLDPKHNKKDESKTSLMDNFNF